MPLRSERGLLHVGGVFDAPEIEDCCLNNKHFVVAGSNSLANNDDWEPSIPNDTVFDCNKWACIYFVLSSNLFQRVEPNSGNTDIVNSEGQGDDAASNGLQTAPQDTTSPHRYYYFARKRVEEQVQWAAYCGARGIICPIAQLANAPVETRLFYMSVILDLVKTCANLIFLFQVPIWLNDGSDFWPFWNEFRSGFGSYTGKTGAQIAIALEATNPPQEMTEDRVLLSLARWRGEWIKLLILNQAIFHVNKTTSLPTLPRLYKSFVLTAMSSAVPIALLPSPTGESAMNFPAPSSSSSMKACVEEFTPTQPAWLTDRKEFLNMGKRVLYRMWDTMPLMDADERARRGYFDVIQAPLQPLADNLEAASYETFESDVMKYNLYQQAFTQILLQPRFKQKTRLHIAYCGAGRGALFDRLFRVLRELGYVTDKVPEGLILTAIEKNSNVARTLKSRVQTDPEVIWRNVNVVVQDMRSWNPPQPFDIVISELLGSFGDNELSPECLDGVQKNLNSDGVIIPYEYCSSIQPISASKVFNAVYNTGDVEKGHVVHLDSYYALSEEGTQPCFKFVHPNKDPNFDTTTNAHNMRTKHITWKAEMATVCHGFAGYFSAKLAENVVCSIDPQDHSPVMEGDVIHLTIKRLTRKNSVWYEWMVGIGASQWGELHNAGGHEWNQIF